VLFAVADEAGDTAAVAIAELAAYLPRLWPMALGRTGGVTVRG